MDGSILKIAYDQCVLELFDTHKDTFYQFDIFYPAPLKQIESGLHPYEIKCKDNLILILKHCVWNVFNHAWKHKTSSTGRL